MNSEYTREPSLGRERVASDETFGPGGEPYTSGRESFGPTEESFGATGTKRTNGHRRRSSLGLLRELTSDGRDLISLEVELAKAEMREKIAVYEKNAGAIAVGGAVLLTALIFGLMALNNGLTVILSEWMGLEIGVWLAPVILTLALAAIGWSMVKGGLEKIRREGAAPSKTIQTLKDDKHWAEGRMHS